MIKGSPPRLFLRFFRWYSHPKLRDHIEGDLMEVYHERLRERGKANANLQFIRDVLLLFRPAIIRPLQPHMDLTSYGMYKNYFTVAFRHLVKTTGYSFINIGGLAIGMVVALFIGLWVYDEISFNMYHEHYEHIAQVGSGSIDPQTSAIDVDLSVQYPVATVLRNNYPQYFKHVLLAWWVGTFTLSVDNNKFNRTGEFIEGGALQMLSLKMLRGSHESLNNPRAIVLSKSTADAIFGDEDPINRTLRINGKMDAEVTGIYEDIPKNNRFSDINFFASWELWVSANGWIKERETDWDNRPFNIYVQLQPGITMEAVNEGIRDLYYRNVPPDFFKTMEKDQPFVQLVPMSTWHLYSEFKNGKPAGGRITYVWLFAVIGVFVLLLACINFINLSTARSEKRAREVGVRKAIGSGRQQLIVQFLSESFVVVMIAFALTLVLVGLLHPWFNWLADKDIALPYTNPLFWSIAGAFIIASAFIAGLYPAFYLSSFQPVKVLKGVSHLGRFGALPRKVLVVVQFTVSVVLIMGTVIVYKQIQFAQNRPIGYDRESLITLEMNDPGYSGKYEVLKAELLKTGVVSQTTTSSSPLTAVWNNTGGYDWPGRDDSFDASFAICNVSLDFGKTVGWEFVAGRDFSPDLPSDSLESIIINEAAVRYMGLQDPVGEYLTDINEFGVPKWTRKIIGVVKDLVMESPYQPVRQTLYFHNENTNRLLHIKINPMISANEALPAIEAALKKVVPTAMFDYKFVDEEYARKFGQEQRIGYLSTVFAVLAIFISCLGLFGLASFVAERRTKEIGIRKVVGASVFNLWKMLSNEFMVLVIISCFVAMPIAYYFLAEWLKKYEYRTEISWWVFLVTCSAALLITLLTVSYQALKAAAMSPVKSLRSE